ncbi:hypothetical protein FI667_g11543, partial [Globisporangium splendens]
MKKQQKEEQAKLIASSHFSDPLSDTGSSTLPSSPGALTFHVLVREEEQLLQRTDVSQQIKELFFTQELSDIEQMERELEFQSHKIHLGQELLTPEQIALVQQLREMNMLELERRQRDKLRNQFTTKEFNAHSPPTPEDPHSPHAILPAHFVPAYKPDFKTYKNDLWARRKRVVQKLVRGISRCIIRARAQKRLDKIKQWLGSATTRAQVQEKVAFDWQQHGSGGNGGSSSRAHLFTPSSSTTTAQEGYFIEGFPLVEEKSYTPPRDFIVQPAEWELKFDTLTFFPLRERDEALLSGHEPLELPPLPTYVPTGEWPRTAIWRRRRMLRTSSTDAAWCKGRQYLLPTTDGHAHAFAPRAASSRYLFAFNGERSPSRARAETAGDGSGARSAATAGVSHGADALWCAVGGPSGHAEPRGIEELASGAAQSVPAAHRASAASNHVHFVMECRN